MKFPLVETDEVSFHALAAEESVLGGRRPLKEEEIPMLPPLPVAADQEEEAEEFAVYIRKPRPKGS